MKRILLFILAVAMLFIPSCSKEEKVAETQVSEKIENVEEMPKGGTITLSSRKPDTFNPLATNYESCRELFYLFYDGLFLLNEDFSYSENLAGNLEMSEDGMLGILTIKNGITFADGTNFTADDVIYSVNFIKENGGSFQGCVKNIKEISKADDHTLMIDFYNPETNFASMLIFPIIKNGTEYFIDCPNGTGQFRCDADDIGYTSLSCEKNASYHLGEPNIDNVNVVYANTDIKAETGFLTGDTDVIINPGFRAEEAGEGINVFEINSNRFEFIGFNSGKGIFSDGSARKAVFAACDRKALANEFESIKSVSATPINPSAYFYTAESEGEGNSSVKGVLEDNGWSMGDNGVYEKDGKSFSFIILVNEDDPERVGIANFLSRSLLKYGISANVEALSYTEYKERLTTGTFDAFMGGCSVGNAANLGFLLGTGGSANVFAFSNNVVDMKIKSMAFAKGDKLVEEAKELSKAIRESAPLAGIYFKTTKIYAKKHISIPESSPTGVYTKAYTWFLV